MSKLHRELRLEHMHWDQMESKEGWEHHWVQGGAADRNGTSFVGTGANFVGDRSKLSLWHVPLLATGRAGMLGTSTSLMWS